MAARVCHDAYFDDEGGHGDAHLAVSALQQHTVTLLHSWQHSDCTAAGSDGCRADRFD